MACWSREHASAIAEGVRRYYKNNPEAKESIRRKLTGRLVVSSYIRTEKHQQKILESRIGGFWYGNVKNGVAPIRYCELWNEDLKERIRAYWGYSSVISGESETGTHKRTGAVRSLSCHHVYYQPKACCVWDNDEKGYYANINIGTFKNKKVIKYYIDGDPNKFVTLTASEHKQIDSNKLEWIKLFENIINDQGGKSYFTKQEIQLLLSDNVLYK